MRRPIEVGYFLELLSMGGELALTLFPKGIRII